MYFALRVVSTISAIVSLILAVRGPRASLDQDRPACHRRRFNAAQILEPHYNEMLENTIAPIEARFTRVPGQPQNGTITAMFNLSATEPRYFWLFPVYY